MSILDNKRIFTISVLTIVFGFAIVCSSLAVSAERLEITDDFGMNVTLDEVPERIISLSPTNTEILFAIGAGDRVVGVTEYCNYPEEAEECEKIGGVSTVSIEKVIALEPDLVLGCELNGKETVVRLTELGVSVAGLNPTNISEIMDDILLIGTLTDEEENASALVASMETRLKEMKNQTTVVKRPKVAHITWHDPIWVAGTGTVQDELIEIAGGDNVFSDVDDWGTVSLEEFIDRNPDVIIVSVGHGVAGMQPYEYIIGEERLNVVNAVKNGWVYSIDADVISRAGPRIPNATETVFGYLNEFFNSTEDAGESTPSPGISPTPTPTATPTPTVTPAPTVTSTPTVTPTPKQPGFEAIWAGAGLLAVVFLLRILKRTR